MRIIILACTLSGCAWLGASALPAAVTAAEVLAQEVLERTGKPIDEHQTHSTYENDPATGKLLILTTVCYRPQPGGVCQ